MFRNMLFRGKNGKHRRLHSGYAAQDSRRFRTPGAILLCPVAVRVEEESLPAVAFCKEILVSGYVLEIRNLVAVDQERIKLCADSSRSGFDGGDPGEKLRLEKGAIAVAGEARNDLLHECSNHMFAPSCESAICCRDDFPVRLLRGRSSPAQARRFSLFIRQHILRRVNERTASARFAPFLIEASKQISAENEEVIKIGNAITLAPCGPKKLQGRDGRGIVHDAERHALQEPLDQKGHADVHGQNTKAFLDGAFPNMLYERIQPAAKPLAFGRNRRRFELMQVLATSRRQKVQVHSVTGQPMRANHVLVIEKPLVEHASSEHKLSLDGNVAGPEVQIAQAIKVADLFIGKAVKQRHRIIEQVRGNINFTERGVMRFRMFLVEFRVLQKEVRVREDVIVQNDYYISSSRQNSNIARSGRASRGCNVKITKLIGIPRYGILQYVAAIVRRSVANEDDFIIQIWSGLLTGQRAYGLRKQQGTIEGWYHNRNAHRAIPTLG